ncbi:MAG: FtsW/RodA/SpoVE family cell cycle protein [Caldibacillus sp.]
MEKKDQQQQERFYWNLAFIIFLLFIASIIALYSGQTQATVPDNYVLQQVVWFIIGALIVALAMFLEPDQYKKLAWVFYAVGVLSLIALHFAPESIAPVTKGAKSWFKIPKVGSIQPSEFMKVFLILGLSRLIADHNEKYARIKNVKTDFWLLIKIGLVAIVPLALIAMQSDMGTALIIAAITLGMILISGITWKILAPAFLGITLLGGAVFVIILYFPELLEGVVEQYQMSRIYSWLDPYKYARTSGYQLILALQAVGSGGISGKGFMAKEVFVPDRHTDFIFSVIAEEYGFIGASALISLFFLLIYHIVKVALETDSPFNSYICAGIISMITFQVFQNIGMNIQLLPITGIPLPFISYGGSSMMGTMMAMGLVFSIKFYHKKYMFTSDDE